MNKPVMYMAHDPISNTEAQVVEFDPALLNAAAAQGVIFIAVDADGDRQIVEPSEVSPPDGVAGSFTLVEPVYVDDRMDAVLDVFDALEAVLFPETSTFSSQSAGAQLTAQANALKRNPQKAFTDKLTALREIVKAGESR